MLNIQALQMLGIDTAEGMAYCADDREFYGEMLEEYISEAKAGAEELEQAHASRDIGSYGIRAHTIKSTSRMIGAKALSEQARELEMAAKSGDEAAVLSLHEAFLNNYLTLVEGIRKNIWEHGGEDA